MSYILDALRKAERERNLGQAPDLRNTPTPQPTSAAPRLSTRNKFRLAAIAVALATVCLVIWLRPSHAPAPAAAPAAPATALVTTMPAPTEVAPPAVSGPEQLDDLLDPETQNKSLPLEEQRKLSSAAPAKPTTVKTTPEPTPIETPAEPEKPSMAEQATADPELPPEVKPLKQMTSDYRGNFPKIRIDVHAYDDDPAKRFVMINGRKYREGETIAEGPSIKAIESDGVVFNYNNQEVLVPIGR